MEAMLTALLSWVQNKDKHPDLQSNYKAILMHDHVGRVSIVPATTGEMLKGRSSKLTRKDLPQNSFRVI